MTNLTLIKLCIWLCQENGEPLDALRQELLLRALEGDRLNAIHINGFSPHYVRRVVAPTLWKTLEQYCGQKVTFKRLYLALSQKYNELSAAEKAMIEVILPQVVVVEKDLDHPQKKKVAETTDNSDIPASDYAFYNQDHTISQFTNLLKDNQHSLIFIFGNGGIGKTALVSQALGRDSELRARTLWCNLSDRLNFHENSEFVQEQWDLPDLTDGTQELSEITSLWQHLKQHKKILVFDHWERLFVEDHLSGSYQPEHQSYANLLEKIAQQSLAGTVVIISREVGTSMENLIAKSPVVCALTVPKLSDQAATNILQEYALQDQHLWAEFVETYRGNPLNIRLLCISIKEWYGGSIAQFKQQNTIIGGDTLRDILRELIHRISSFEQEILYWLMLWGQPITLEQLQTNYPLEMPFASQIWDVVRSLERRFLLEKIPNENPPLLTLQPSIQRYLAQEFTKECCTEIMQAIAMGYEPTQFNLLKNYQLSLQSHPEAIALSPVIQLIIKSLHTHFRNDQQINFHLQQLKEACAEITSETENYVLKNLDTLSQYLT